MRYLISRSELLNAFNNTGIQITFDLPVEEVLGEDVDLDDFLMLVQDAIHAYKKMVIDTIKNQPKAFDIDKVFYELKTDSSVKLYGSQNIDNYMIPVKRAIEIVKQGGVADDVCEWKLEDEEANLYLTGCQQRQLIFEGTPKENGYKFCPYCGKKLKAVN